MFNVFRRQLNVNRKADGSFIDGYWTDGAESSFQILASVQKADGKILDTLPEGYRTRVSYVLFTDTKLRVAKAGKYTPDIVVIDSQNFQVTKIMDWQNLDPTKHYEVVVTQENVEEA